MQVEVYVEGSRGFTVLKIKVKFQISHVVKNHFSDCLKDKMTIDDAPGEQKDKRSTPRGTRTRSLQIHAEVVVHVQ